MERRRHPVPHAAAVGAAARAHHDRVLRSRRRAHRPALRRGRPRRRGPDPAARARTPTSDSCSSPAKRRTASSSTHGVELWNFQPSMLHAKVMTVDGVVANIGSANLNSRSTACDEEINVVALDPELVRILDEQFDDDLERSVQIKEVRWERRTLPQRVAEHARHPAAALVLAQASTVVRGDGDRCPADPRARGAGRVTSTGTSPSIASPGACGAVVSGVDLAARTRRRRDRRDPAGAARSPGDLLPRAGADAGTAGRGSAAASGRTARCRSSSRSPAIPR